MEDKNFSKELSVITQNWLQANNIKVNAAFLKDEITTHPDYPALTSLTDFLESGGMAYDAVQADASYIHEFNYPLLAHIKRPGNEYLHLINDASVWDKEKSITENWSGIALYASKGATWHNEENYAAEKAAQKNKYVAAAFVMAGVALFIGSVFIQFRDYIFLKDVISTSIFGLLSVAGLAISIAALGRELGYQSKLVKQICGMVGNGGCEKVLGSKFAKGVAGITPADASILYFAAQFLLYLMGCFYTAILNGIITIAFVGLVVAAWSIYTQAVKVKEWCALCLSIVAVLIGQIIIASYLQLHDLTSLIANSQLLLPITVFIITTLLSTIIYLPIKDLIKTNIKNKQDINSFKKWKTDDSLFITQWEKEPTCDNSMWENDLFIGNANAPIRITVACNPYCGPCARAHDKLDKLVEKHPSKIAVQIRMLCNHEDANDKRTIAVKAILKQSHVLKNNEELKQMLSNWFDWMNYEKWTAKWSTNNDFSEADMLLRHDIWNKENGITHTPTFFVNGRKLPGRYDILDIDKMVSQLEYAFV